MKKIIAGLVSAALALGCAAMPAEVTGTGSVIKASAYETCGDYDYEVLDDGTVSIVGYGGTDTDVVIPSTLDGKTVSTIGTAAFWYCSDIESVTLPNTVTSIESRAFDNCLMKSITIPDSVTSIASYAFADCSELTSVTIPNSISRLEDRVFYNCRGLKSVTIPKSVKSIGEEAFAYCESLKSVTIPSSVERIEKYAFASCIGLTSVTLPDSITAIEEGVFANCLSLESITLPDSVETIGKSAFQFCSKLKNISIPDGVKTIGGYAFHYCEKMERISLPNSIESMGEYVFAKCSSLTSISIPDKVESINTYAFYCCTSLEIVAIPRSVNFIGSAAFGGCSSLTSVYYAKAENDDFGINILDGNYEFTHAEQFFSSVYVPEAVISQDYISTGTSFTLNWEKIYGVTGYILYRYDSANKKWVKVTTVKGENNTSVTVSGYTPGSVVKFKVNAYKTEDGSTYYGKTNEFLYAAALDDSKISSDYSSTGTSFTLKWDKVAGAAGYKIFKYSGATGEWVVVKTVKGADTLSAAVSGYTPGSVIKFMVKAYVVDNGKTYLSETNNSIYAAAIAPAAFKSYYTASTNYAMVNWNKVEGATGYKIYKYDSANKKWVLAKTVTDTTKTSTYVTGLASGKTTTLKINAYLTKGSKTYYGKAGTMVKVTTK